MSERESFEARAAQKLRLPVEIISSARNGDGYLHAFDSMSVMQPLNGWWEWWQASREALKDEQGYPERLPCSVLIEPGLRFGKGVKTQLVLDALQRRDAYYAEREAMTPEQRAEQDEAIRSILNLNPIDTTSQQYEALSKGESK